MKNKKYKQSLILLFLIILAIPVIFFLKRTYPSDGKIILYYFYNGEFRCESCIKMEKVVYDVLKEKFKKELNEGGITWKPLNKEEPENARYRDDLDVTYNILILSEEKSGKIIKFKHLDDAWDLIWKDKELKEYIENEIKTYLYDR